MTYQEVRKMAKGLSINTFGKKKVDVIRGIQLAEHNVNCYATDRVEVCGEYTCLWRAECLSQFEGKEN